MTLENGEPLNLNEGTVDIILNSGLAIMLILVVFAGVGVWKIWKSQRGTKEKP